MLIWPLKNFDSLLDILKLFGIPSDGKVCIFLQTSEAEWGIPACVYGMQYGCLTWANASSDRKTDTNPPPRASAKDEEFWAKLSCSPCPLDASFSSLLFNSNSIAMAYNKYSLAPAGCTKWSIWV